MSKEPSWDGEPYDIAGATSQPAGAAQPTPGQKPEPGPSQATRLVQLAAKRFAVLAGEDGYPYAVRIDGPNLALPMRGHNGLRQMLARDYYLAYKTAPSAAALTDALAVLTGEAAERDRQPVALRLDRFGRGIVIDLGTADGRAVVVRPGYWEIVDRSPVLFRRTALTGEMAIPVRGGDIAVLHDLVNAGEVQVRLMVGWLVAGLIPDLPHPILAVFGEQGTAKTTLMRLLALLLDPSPAPTRTAPRDVKQWAVLAAASWLIALDNVSTVSDWQSDAYCRAVTGDALTDRALYSDSDVSVIAFRRVLALTSIDAGALRGDLGDRMLPVELDRIDPAQRRTDAEITARFAAAAPALFGAVLDLLAAVLAALPGIHSTQLPRMADFARVLAALDEVTGWTTVADYATTAADIAETVIDSDSFAVAVRALAVDKVEWTGTAGELGVEVSPDKPPKGWPRSPRAVAGAVRRITPALRAVGVSVEHARSGHDRARTITLRYEHPTADEPADGADGESHLPSVEVEPEAGLWGDGHDRRWESASAPSAPSAHGPDQHKHADGSTVPTVRTEVAHARADGRPSQPSAARTPSDLRQRQDADGADGWDGESQSQTGRDRWRVSGAPIEPRPAAS